MELDITDFIAAMEPHYLSASVAEIGQDAGRITWENAKDYVAEHPLLSNEEQREAARDYLAGYVAWSEEEIAGWSDQELDALLAQFIASELREFQELAEGCWDTWEQLSSEGTVSGSLFLGIDGRTYYYMGI